MAFKLNVNLFVQSLVLCCCYNLVKSNPLSRSSTCNPRDGLTGTVETVVVRVERFDDTSVNFRRDNPRLLSTVHRTISKDGKLYFLDHNLKAKFHGREVCLSAVKETIMNEKGADERRQYSCEQVCLEVGAASSLVTNSSSGGRVWPGKTCCVWSKLRYFQLTLMNTGPKCLSCLGRECLHEQLLTKQCSPGDQCVAVTLNQKQNTTETNSSIVPIMLGCSSDDALRGYTCNAGCRREVKLVGSGARNVCVRCCTGDECNRVVKTPKNQTESAPFGGGQNHDSAPKNGSLHVRSNDNLMVILLIMTLWLRVIFN